MAHLENPSRADETTPLLSSQPPTHAHIHDLTTPLPKLQLGLLCSLRLLDPLNFSQILPYINQFILALHVTNDPAKLALYSGLVESVFAACQLLTIYPWAAFSDSLGRRPIILAGVSGLGLSTLLCGLSYDLPSLLLSRAFAGFFSGNVSVIPAVLCEITDSTNASVAFPFFGLWWPLGAIIGPLIGGTLANPTDRFPSLRHVAFLKHFPYFLPCFVVSSVTLLIFILSALFLKETLVVSREKRSQSNEEANTQRLMMEDSTIRALCHSALCLSFISTAFEVLFPLFCFTSPEIGGLGLPVAQIGYALAMSGVIAALLQVLVMPGLLRRYSHTAIYHSCMKSWVVTFALFLCYPFITSRNAESAVWTVLAVQLICARIGFLCFSVNMLIIKSSCASKVGAACGVLQVFVCLARAVSPFVVSSVFGFSITTGWLGGYLWVGFMMFVCWISTTLSRRLVVNE